MQIILNFLSATVLCLEVFCNNPSFDSNLYYLSLYFLHGKNPWAYMCPIFWLSGFLELWFFNICEDIVRKFYAHNVLIAKVSHTCCIVTTWEQFMQHLLNNLLTQHLTKQVNRSIIKSIFCLLANKILINVLIFLKQSFKLCKGPQIILLVVNNNDFLILTFWMVLFWCWSYHLPLLDAYIG